MKKKISSEFPYRANFTEVYDSKIHYVDAGKKGGKHTFLLLHGNPTSSYLWRNIIPHLEPLGRVIVPDLIGFGKSDKPYLEYTYRDHIRYINKFIETLDLKNIILVVQDWGSAIGFNYSATHSENVAGIVFFEAITKPFIWEELALWERLLFKAMKHDTIGYWLNMKHNFFIKILLPAVSGRFLTKKEREYYLEPFKTQESRIPVWMFPREVSISRKPLINTRIILRYHRYHMKSKMPKLMFYTKPGLVLKYKDALRLMTHWSHMTSKYLGFGGHYLQEQYPHEIGEGIVSWYKKNFK